MTPYPYRKKYIHTGIENKSPHTYNTNNAEQDNIPLPSEFEHLPNVPEQERTFFLHNILKNIQIDDILLIGLIFILLKEEKKDEILIIILIFLLLSGFEFI